MNLDFSKYHEYIPPAFYGFIKSRKRYAILYGGRGSGKSYAATMKLLYRAFANKERFLIVRKTAHSQRGSTYQLFNDVARCFKMRGYMTFNKSLMSIVCDNGSEFIFRGCDDVSKIKSIAGITSVWIEEASELTEEDFINIDLCLREKNCDYEQILLSFNPVSERSWLKSYFFDRHVPESEIWKTTYLDNPFLPDRYGEILEELKKTNYDLYKVSALGEWGSYTGTIFSPTLVNTLDEDEDFDRKLPFVWGVDVGFSDPSVLVKVWYNESAKKIYVHQYLYENKLITANIIQKLKNIRIKSHEKIYIDNASPEVIAAIHQAGFNSLPCRKGKDSVIAGINWIKEHELFIRYEDHELVKDLQSYAWSLDREGKAIDKPNHFGSHGPDAIRYACYSEWFKQKTLQVLDRKIFGV